MAEEFDVSSRLAEGRPAVENLQHYVWACHQLGYQHPDLTLHAVQIRDWYGSEDGMDLTALQSDWLALEDAARASQDALAVQDRQLAVFSAVWQGAGAEASRDFLRRHGDASAAAVAAVRTATEALGALRESLWGAVDAKVDAVVAIEGGAQDHRAEWLAAAATVTSGVGDRAVAAELVDQAVKPFVNSSIRSDWLAAIHTAMSSVTGAYQRAADEIAAEHRPVFDVPGDFGSSWSPRPAYFHQEAVHQEAGYGESLPAAAPAGPATPPITVPSGWGGLPAAAAAPQMPTPAAAAGPLALPPEVPAGPAVPALPLTPPPGGMGSGIPDFGGGLPGLGQQFADTLSGLLGGADSAVPDVPDLDVPELDDPLDIDEEGEEGEEDEEDEEVDDDAADGDAADGEEGDGEVVGEALAEELYEPPSDPAPAPTSVPPPAEPLPPADLPTADPVAAEQTPCAIAADELPQVGDPP